MLKGKKILLGITASIAAYKALVLIRLLVKEGAEVQVIMTPAAKDFVTPLSLSTLSKNPVLIELFDEQSWANHVMLGRWADLMLIAPLSCNTLAKMAAGLCDNLLLATYLSATYPVVVAPAMDEDMWQHASTRANLQKIASFSNQIISVGHGELASGLVGAGRMAEPEEILDFIRQHFFQTGELTGKKALVTAGPTYEAIDPVRFIGNHSSGKMGLALARELTARGAEVTLVLGPVSLATDNLPVKLIRVETAEEMYQACQAVFPSSDITVMSAAVADYRPAQVSDTKIKKKEGGLTLDLIKTRDILSSLGAIKRKGQILVGFALEKDQEQEYALEKLERKNADLIVLNSLRDAGAGFGGDTNKVTLFTRTGEVVRYGLKSKQQVAKDIVDSIVKLTHG